jgi:inhibitor of KinA sporulation pathway (predicted exonuclease)
MADLNSSKVLCLDLELTCGGKKDTHKIIQISIVEIDTRELVITRESMHYIRPYGDYHVDWYCRKLTGIDDEIIKKEGKYLHEALNSLKHMGYVNKLTLEWGSDHKPLTRICKDNCINYEFKFLDLGTLFKQLAKLKDPISVANALKMLGLEFEGKPHDALVDARNTARIYIELIRRFRQFNTFNIAETSGVISLPKLPDNLDMGVIIDQFYPREVLSDGNTS